MPRAQGQDRPHRQDSSNRLLRKKKSGKYEATAATRVKTGETGDPTKITAEKFLSAIATRWKAKSCATSFTKGTEKLTNGAVKRKGKG